MTLIYEKPSHFVLGKTWDKKTLLPKTYRLQSNDPCNKIKPKVHQDSGKFGIKFTVNKTIPKFEMGAKKLTSTRLTPLWSSRMYFRGSTRLPGSRFSMRTF
jgi:hypothetical protein